MKKYIIAAILLLPAYAGAVTNNVHHTKHLPKAKRAEVQVDKRMIRTDNQGLQNAYQNLHNDQLHGNRSEVEADLRQIKELKQQLHTDTLELSQDSGYTYVRKSNYKGWGQNYNNSNHQYKGWGN